MGRASIVHPLRPSRLGRRAFAGLGFAALASLGLLSCWVFSDPWRPTRVFADSLDETPIAFSPDGKALAMRRRDAGISPWDVASGRRGPAWSKDGPSFGLASAFSPDGKTFANTVGGANLDPNSTSDTQIELIDVATGLPRLTLATNRPFVYRLDWSPDGGSLHASVGSTSRLVEIIAWEAATGRKRSAWQSSSPPDTISAGIAPDGKTLAIPRAGTGLDLWDLEHDRIIGRLDTPSTFRMHPNAIAYSADGRALIVGRDDGSAGLWDLPSRTLLKTIPVHPRGCWNHQIQVSPDGRTFASVTYPKQDNSPLARGGRYLGWKLFGWRASPPQPEVVIVDIASGRTLARAQNSKSPVYSPDGRTIAVHDERLGVVIRDVPPSP